MTPHAASEASDQSTGAAGLSVALVGPGKVGTSLGLWLAGAGADVQRVVGRHLESAAATVSRFAAPVVSAVEVMGHPWQLLLLAVPDGELSHVAADLAAATGSDRAGIALHTSGSHDAEVLAPLRSVGIAVGTLHPLLAFPEVRERPQPGVIYGTDGDEAALALAGRLAAAFGGETVRIPAEQRLLYHYCATLAAGGLSTVLAVVDELAARSVLDPATRAGFLKLAEAAVRSASERADAATGITGPVARGEVDLAAAQLAAACRIQPELRDFLEAVHQQTRRQVSRGSGMRGNDESECE